MQSTKPTNIRWWIASMLTAFAFVSYLQRINISVTAALMAPELHLSKVQLGQIFSSFLIGYAIFQVPAGLFADRYGTRITLALSAILWGVCTLLTGGVPAHSFMSVGSPFLLLWLVRFLLGSVEATTYPVGALAVRNWIRPAERGFANSLMFAGTSMAAAFTTPLVSWLMLRMGWRWVYVLTSVPAFLIGLAWWFFSTNRPREHRGINQLELPLTAAPETGQASATAFAPLLRNRKILLLCASYVAEGYLLFIFVFWLYLYLIDVRRFSLMNGGLVAALPWLTGLALTPVGGYLMDRLAARSGRLVAAKQIIMVSYSTSGVLLLLAAYAPTRWTCVAALCLSVGFLMASETCFWVSATTLAGPHAAAVSGLMNTAGIAGGIASTSLVPIIVAHSSWLVAFGSATVVALVCVSLWIVIGRANPEEQPDTPPVAFTLVEDPR